MWPSVVLYTGGSVYFWRCLFYRHLEGVQHNFKRISSAISGELDLADCLSNSWTF
jgi:hypothetical protein